MKICRDVNLLAGIFTFLCASAATALEPGATDCKFIEPEEICPDAPPESCGIRVCTFKICRSDPWEAVRLIIEQSADGLPCFGQGGLFNMSEATPSQLTQYGKHQVQFSWRKECGVYQVPNTIFKTLTVEVVKWIRDGSHNREPDGVEIDVKAFVGLGTLLDNAMQQGEETSSIGGIYVQSEADGCNAEAQGTFSYSVDYKVKYDVYATADSTASVQITNKATIGDFKILDINLIKTPDLLPVGSFTLGGLELDLSHFFPTNNQFTLASSEVGAMTEDGWNSRAPGGDYTYTRSIARYAKVASSVNIFQPTGQAWAKGWAENRVRTTQFEVKWQDCSAQ